MLTIGANGQLEDAVINVDDDSHQAKFARAMTTHYESLGEILPFFRQLRKFYKISGAIGEMQKKRLLNQAVMKISQQQLDDASHWRKEAEKRRKEWTENLHSQAYWEGMFNEKKAAISDYCPCSLVG